jgi:transposase-like protein
MSELDVPSRRIDKGVKRGPRLKPGPKRSAARSNNGRWLPILPNEPQAIKRALEDYSKGATLQQIANKHGVTRHAVYTWLLGDLGGEQHNALVTQALTARIAEADEVLETSESPLNVQRGREQARFARMDYERRRPHLYGQKNETTVTVVPVLSITVAPMPNAALLQSDQPGPITIEHKQLVDK